MIGPTRHLLSPNPLVTHLPSLPPDDANGILVENTLNLHDPAAIWPNRSLERRRAFQHLLNRCITGMELFGQIDVDILCRYNRQILYGCKNPRCETPTCLSRQRRVAKGLFRPYTILSARTLATFLTSQDHSESGLCPHQPADIDLGPGSPAKVKAADKRSEKRGGLLTSPRSSHATAVPQPAGSIGFISNQGRKLEVHITNEHTKTLRLKPDTSRSRSYEESQNHTHVRKDKDPKSFTQNLFDTVAMKILHRAIASDEHPPWAPSNERARWVGSSNLDSNQFEHKTDGGISKDTEKDTKKPSMTHNESARAAHGCSPTQLESVPDTASVESNVILPEVTHSCSIVQGFTGLEKDFENLKTSVDDEKAHPPVKIKANDSVLTSLPPSNGPQPDHQAEEMNLAETSVPDSRPSERNSNIPVQSLSHFTNANIIALKESWAVRQSDLYGQHWLLKFLGRTDLPQHSSGCGAYGDFLTFSGQSMTYILSNVDALFQSFLHYDDSNARSKVVWSYDFASIVDLFRKLRRIDMHPHKIFPSLWISAGRLYPVATANNKRRSLTALDSDTSSLNPPPDSQGRSLNDLEACHIAKIILAALVASVPKCSPMGWLAVRKLHASGQVAPFIDADSSPAEQKMIGKLVRTLHAFENEMALSLAVRLARSIDIRYHLARTRALAEDVEKHRRQFPPTFSRILDYLNANELKFCVADSEGQPSVKGGEWIDPAIEPNSWNPREWPIVIEWLRAVILKEWDGKARVAKGSAVGGALGLMLYIRKLRISCFLYCVLT